MADRLLTRQVRWSNIVLDGVVPPSTCFARRRANHTSVASGVAYAENTRCNQSLKLDCKRTERQRKFQLLAFWGLLLDELP